ncbi:MAG TPA: FlgD immunoglobulin-like domain containing protein [Candidatus Cloacimonadota bacterium]|nr:FlgD immunoglobulin-like domain containing protein [Candidatus Cloacimonadota bacterium]
MKKRTFLCLVLVSLGYLFGLDNWNGYTCPNDVMDIYEDVDYLWLATDGGLVKMNKITGEHEVYNSANSFLTTNFLTTVEKDAAGNLWVGSSISVGDMANGFYTSGGIHILHPDGTTTYYNQLNSPLPSNHVRDIKFDSEGNTWITMFRAGVTKIDIDGNWTNFNMNNSGLNSNSVNSVAIDHNDEVWFGLLSFSNGISMTGGGLAHYEDDTIIDYTNLLPATESHNIMQVNFDENDILWIAASYEGYFSYDGTNITQYSTIEYSSVNALQIVDGNHYLATNLGLTLYENGVWTQYNGSNSIMNEYCLRSILVDNDNVCWCGSEYWSFFRYANGSITEYPILDENSFINSIWIDDIAVQSDSSIWIGNGFNLINNGIGGLVHYNGGNDWTTYNFEDTGDFLYNDIFIRNRTVYVATGNEFDYGGIMVYDQGNWTRYDYANTNGGFPFVAADNVAVGNSGTIYASRVCGGICVFDGQDWFEFSIHNSSLASDIIYTLVADPDEDNVLWIGTAIGLQRMVFDNNDTTFENIACGLGCISSLNYDENHHLWVGSTEGATMYDGYEWHNYNNILPTIPTSGYITGVWDIDVDQYDRVWFATDCGIYVLDGEEVTAYNSENSSLPINAIHNIELDLNNKIYIGTYACGLYSAEYSAPVSKDNSLSVKPFVTHNNYPNPFNPSTTIRFEIPEAGPVRVEIYNVKGQITSTLMNEELCAGTHSIIWNGTNYTGNTVANGVYFYNIRYQGNNYIHKMLLLK